MIRVISFGGKYAVFDSESLALIPVGPLAVPMVPYLKEPLPADCPVSIRYALAQYPSPEISATYQTLREAWEKGLLFAPARTSEPPVSRVILASPTEAAIASAAGIAASAPYPVEVLLSDPSDPLSAVAAVKEAIPTASVSVLLHGVVPSAPLLAAAEVLVVVHGASDPLLSDLSGTSAVPVLDVPAGELVPAVEALSASGFRRISSLPSSPEDARALAAKLRRKKDAAPVFLPFSLVHKDNLLLPVREALIAPDGTVSLPDPPSAASPFRLLSPSSSPWSLACAEQALNLALMR